MTNKLPKPSTSPVLIGRRERREIKRATSRYLRREAKRNPETHLGIDARSRTRGWAD